MATVKNNIISSSISIMLIKYFTIGCFIANLILSCKRNRDNIVDNKQINESQLIFIDSLIKKAPLHQVNSYLDSSFSNRKNNHEAYIYYCELVATNYYQKKDSISSYLTTSIHYTDSAIDYIEKYKLENTFSKEYARILSLKASFCNINGNYKMSAQALSKSIFLSQGEKDSCMLVDNLNRLALVYYKQENHIKAIENYKKSLRILNFCTEQSSKFNSTQRTLDDMALNYRKLLLFDSAIKYDLMAAKFVLENHKSYTIDTIFKYEALQNIYVNTGISYYLKGDLPNAKQYFGKSLLYCDSFANNPYSGIAALEPKVYLAQIYFDNKQYKVSNGYSISDNDTNSLFPKLKVRWYEFKKNVADLNKNYKQSNDYLQRIIRINDSLNHETIYALKQDPQAEFDRIDKIHQLQLVKKEAALQKNKTFTAITIGVLAIFLALNFFYYLRKNKKMTVQLKFLMQQNELQAKQQQQEQLYLQEIRLQAMHNTAILNQRKKISEDLHDDLSGSLVALRYYINDLKQQSQYESEKSRLASISEELNAVYANARQYMHNLKHNEDVFNYSLPLLLKSMSSRFNETSALHFETMIEDDLEDLLSLQQHDQLYFIVNEALSNVIKHSKATNVKLQITCKEKRCKFLIIDNGIGFVAKNDTLHGLGIKSIKSRVQDLKGEINWQTGINGTKIEGSFPID